MAPGTQVFTYLNVGKETVRGTPVAPTRQLYTEGTSSLKFDNGPHFHEQDNAGVRTRIRRVTRTREDVEITFRTDDGVEFDDLIVPFSQLRGAQTGTGAGADKAWDFTPSMTAANNPEAYSVDIGDETQNWRCQYSMFSSFKISAPINDVTQLEGVMFAQRAIKTAKANPALNSGIKIPTDLWTIKFAASAAGLTGASVNPNFLKSWELEVFTGLKADHTQDGNLFFGQHVETDISATLSMTVESTALAVSEFVDKHTSDTLDFIRLKAQGPVLGSTFYIAQLDLPVLYQEPEPIAEEVDGINLYKVVARLAYDGTGAKSIIPTFTTSLAALP